MNKTEFYNKYGKVQVKFSGYYKYCFVYDATLADGKRLVVWYGGDSDSIYKHDVTADNPVTVECLVPYAGYVYDGVMIVEEYYE